MSSSRVQRSSLTGEIRSPFGVATCLRLRCIAPATLHPHTVPPTAGAAVQAAQRILTLATESLDMMRGVTGVVKDSLDRADAWVGRLRVVGIQRGPNDAEGDDRPGHDHSMQSLSASREDEQDRSSKTEDEEEGDMSHMRTPSCSSLTLSSIPSTPYSVPGTPAPGPIDVPSPGVVTGIAGLSLGMAARGGELGIDMRKPIEYRKGGDEEMDVDE